jgi:signal transduction histidine kinase/ActR/RegA family two-component response regulator
MRLKSTGIKSPADAGDGLNRLAASSAGVAVFEGREHRLRLINGAWRALFGFRGASGERLREVSAGKIASAVLGRLDRVFDAGHSDHFQELSFQADPHGRALERFYRGVIAPVRSTAGPVRGVMLVCCEVTDDVLARRLAADPRSLVWSGLADDGTDYVNARGIAYTGDEAATSWQRIIHRDELDDCAHARDAAIRGEPTSEIEVRIRRGDGAYRWHRLRFVAVRSEPAPARWFGIAVDHDEAHEAVVELALSREREQAAEANARQANRLKELFLASASHELRAPITTMLLWEKVMRDDPDDGEIRVRALDAIRQSAMTQAQLVADLLDVARAVSGKLRVDLRAVQIGHILIEAIEAAEPLAAARQQSLVRHIDDGLGQVAGDAHRLRQIFDNLLANAVKFTEKHGRIGVFARRENTKIVIEFSDTGRGITPDFLPHVFEPFSQADDAMTRSGGGLGLGLAIAHQLAGSHGGTLVADSLGEDRGATFTVTLPALAQQPRTAKPSLPAPRLSGMQLLIVDDDPRVRDALQLLLERAGAVVVTAASADAGLGEMERSLPDVVLSDIAMPGEDGYSFVRRLRQAQGKASSVPAVAITAHVTDGDRKRALEAGFDFYLTKPLNIDHLISTIARLVDSRRAPRE